MNEHSGPPPYTPLSVAPVPPSPGMTAAQLGEYVDAFVRGAVERVNGVGAEQYAEDAGQRQRFERMPLAELLDWTLEEVQDVAVYAAMLGVRLQWLKAQLTERGNPPMLAVRLLREQD